MYLLVSYDIVDDKRRRRIANFLLNYGRRLQKSVFECHINEQQMQEIFKNLKELIDRREDKLRFWRICKDCLNRVEVVGWGYISFDDDEFWVV